MKTKNEIDIRIKLMFLATLCQVFLPRWFSIWVAKFFGSIYFWLAPKRRLMIYENMKHILGNDTPFTTINYFTKKFFRNYAICLADLLRAPLMTKEKLLAMVEFDGEANFKQALAEGKGAILISAHIGNWDLAGIFLSHLGYKLSAVVEPIPKGISDAMNRYRGLGGMELIALTDKERMEQILKQKKILILLADRDLTGHGFELPCFDARRSYPRGPAVFALKYQVPIVFGYLILNPQKGRPYLGVIEPRIIFTKSDDDDQAILNLTEAIAQRINQIIAKYPDQWFVFRADWRR